ncbi:SDR family oxidoreductase [Actinokineospora bangkokensis]|uniref:Oxidoreductase n=1 Tax=Actinokineospora bangkokensis TaxID=1193682 RepID=A0A1Q9LNV2_9PSEU|nr:SDR family NAD(P)-dependent oxidoreductase [Actinokineospora bangkokensis]OLR93683.1 hypothetical protein BJP25_15595 [Actinokineospora bangkokensis]
MSAALVTGATSGVGFALAQRLLATGTAVLTCGRDPDRLAAARRRLPGLRTVTADLAVPADVDRVALVAATLPGLDLLVNNAAVQLPRDWLSHDPAALLDDTDTELGTNLAAPLRLTAHLLPVLADQDSAAVVSVTSALGTVPKRSAPTYCATKAALSAFTTALNHQLTRDAPNVRAVEVVLPLVDTAMTAGRGSGKISPDAAADGILAGLRRGGTTVRVGKVGVLLGVHRFSPRLAARLVAD